MRSIVAIAGVAAAVLALPAGGASSVAIGNNLTRVTLRVDARGYAEVGWTVGGARRYMLVPPRGRILRGQRLARRDVSRPYSVLQLPFQRVLRRTPDGRLWGVQAWQRGRAGIEVRFSRWRGAPTQVTLKVLSMRPGPVPRLIGQASFQGRPVTGYSSTPAGDRFRHFAYVDCFACPAAQPGQWGRMLAVATQEDGSFAVALRPEWMGARYRATVTGPNRGATIAPDDSVAAEPQGPPPPPP